MFDKNDDMWQRYIEVPIKVPGTKGTGSKYMPRTPRVIDPHGIYHIVCRGNNKSLVFGSRDDYLQYLWLLGRAKLMYGFSLYHYALMPNHVHLIVKPNGNVLPEVFHDVQLKYAKYFCHKYLYVGHVWQLRYKSILIDSDSYAFACGNYIEMNPVRAKLVDTPEKWEWSSYGFYAYGERNALVDTDPMFISMGNAIDQTRARYRYLIDKTRA